jgi:hypothetical protein
MLRLLPIFSVTTLLACTTQKDNSIPQEQASQDTQGSQDTEASSEDTEAVPLSEEGQWAAQYHEDIKSIVQAEEQFSQLNHLEDLVEKTEDNILKPWMKSWKTGDINSYKNLFAENASTLNWLSNQVTETRNFSGIKEFNWVITEGEDSADSYLNFFTSIEDFDLKVDFIEEQGDKILLTLEYDLRAIRPDSYRQQDRGHITITTDKECKQILGMQASTIERIVAERAPAFVEKI